jgi:RHS repeat-associated protein
MNRCYPSENITYLDLISNRVLLLGVQIFERNYRYGFNGMEKDDEVKGNSNSYDFGARMYDNRLGRFFSVDPRIDEQAHASSYCFVDNSPLVFIDEDGKIKIIVHEKKVDGTSNIKLISFEYVDDGSNCLTVHYQGENFDRSDFKEGSFESKYMHSNIDGYSESKSDYYTIERWQMKGKLQVSPKTRVKSRTSWDSRSWAKFLKLDINFKGPDKSTFDDAGVEDFDNVKSDVEIIQKIFKNNLVWDKELGVSLGRSENTKAVVIGFHSPHPTDDAQVKNPTLAKKRALNTSKTLGSDVDATPYYGGEDTRKASLIIGSKGTTKLYKSSNSENKVK